MAASVNRVTLLGNLAADPEIRHTHDGKGMANLRMATSEKWKDKHTGEPRERTEWHRVTVWGDSMVDFIQRALHKGSKVYLEGRLQTRKVQDHNTGHDRFFTEVVVQWPKGLLVGLDSRPSTGYGRSPTSGGYDDHRVHGGGHYDQHSGRGNAHERSVDGGFDQADDVDDDVPF